MKNTRDELMEEYDRILTAAHGKPRPMTEEEYRELERGSYSTSGEGTEWSPSTEVVSGEGAEWNPVEKEIVAPEVPESPSGWPKKVELPDGSVEIMRSPEEWRKSITERDPKRADEETLEKMKEMKGTVQKLEEEMGLAEMERDIGKIRSMVSRLEQMVDEEEERRKPPTVQSGETEWKR